MPNAARLDAVTQAKGAYALAKATLESKLREQLEKEISALQVQLDLAIRYAYDDGHKKSAILRALGTKDFYTLSRSLERTRSFEPVEGVNPLDNCYQFDPDTGEFEVSYNNHGPQDITGTAVFDFRVLDDGTSWFMSKTPLWNASYTVKNDVVAALNDKQDGYYYEEALGWINEQL